MYISYMASQLL